MVTTAVDTNILVTLFRADVEKDATAAQTALETASALGEIVISPVIYAELFAAPRMERNSLEDTRIRVEWQLARTVWEHAAGAFRAYAERRRAGKSDPGPRRILADFSSAHTLAPSPIACSPSIPRSTSEPFRSWKLSRLLREHKTG